MNRPLRRLTLAAALLVAGLPTLPVLADYPARQDPRINDFANLLSTTETTELRAHLADLQRDTGVELVVVTVPSWHTYGTRDATIEPFATGLFNRWGIGDRERNDGALLLVARDDRELRIELGARFGHRYDGQMKRVIDDTIVPRFRGGEMGRGIVEGALATAAVLEPGWSPGVARSPQAAAPPIADPTPPSATAPENAAGLPTEAPPGAQPPPQRPRPPPVDVGPRTPFGLSAGCALFVLAAIAAVPVLLVLLLFRIFRGDRGTRRCPECEGTLHRLDEAADDAHLSRGQQAEEAAASVDYRVWACDSCDHVEMIRKKRWFSGRKKCTRCGFRTLKTDSVVVDSPTRWSTGLERRTHHCSNCDHLRVEEVVLAMLADTSDSSSSSSFSGGSSSGGGSSGGGGASGSW